MSTPLDDKCVGRFERLLVYFRGLTKDDIKNMTLEDIMSSVDLGDRLLTRAFLRVCVWEQPITSQIHEK